MAHAKKTMDTVVTTAVAAVVLSMTMVACGTDPLFVRLPTGATEKRVTIPMNTAISPVGEGTHVDRARLGATPVTGNAWYLCETADEDGHRMPGFARGSARDGQLAILGELVKAGDQETLHSLRTKVMGIPGMETQDWLFNLSREVTITGNGDPDSQGNPTVTPYTQEELDELLQSAGMRGLALHVDGLVVDKVLIMR